MKTAPLPSLFLAAILAFSADVTHAAEKVTVFNFARAESDNYFANYVKQGAFGKFLHLREPTPIDKQTVIRMQLDTLYSFAVFDLAEPVTIVKPESGGRFQSMIVVSEDHSIPPVEHGPGEFTITRDKLGTRYCFVALRTFVNPNIPADLKAARALQDQVEVRQKSPGSFEIPDWDEASLKKIRDAVNVLAADLPNAKGCFGEIGRVDPILHLLGTAYGWGGNPEVAAMYDNFVPSKNDGKTLHSLTVKDVPVDGFWSVTVYNKDGFMQRNEQDAYSFNNVTAKPNPDGSFTINFGGGPDAINNLPITPGWNYIVRLYQPRKEILDGTWEFPPAKPVK